MQISLLVCGCALLGPGLWTDVAPHIRMATAALPGKARGDRAGDGAMGNRRASREEMESPKTPLSNSVANSHLENTQLYIPKVSDPPLDLVTSSAKMSGPRDILRPSRQAASDPGHSVSMLSLSLSLVPPKEDSVHLACTQQVSKQGRSENHSVGARQVRFTSTSL